MISHVPCPICFFQYVAVETVPGSTRTTVRCRRCGEFILNPSVESSLEALTEHGNHRYLLSAVLRESSERGHALELTTYNVPDLISAARAPQDPFEAIDRLLLHLFDKAETPTASVEIYPDQDYPLVYARDGQEFARYLSKAEGLGYIERQDFGVNVQLDLKGWERIAELRRTRTVSDQAFVAMWFAPEMLDAWEAGIKPALQATGYRPVRLDMEEHNEKVDDRIIAEIRRSGLVVADFSGDRSNVYFEAGFALGLGIPVIWTCRAQDVEKLHFDTRQYNYIAWSNPADLRAKLQLRIEATIPTHPAARTRV